MNIIIGKATTFDELPKGLQILIKTKNPKLNPTLADITTLDDKDLQKIPMYLRYRYDRKRVPILHTVVLITMVMCVLGISTAMFLAEPWERTVLSLCYGILFVAASMNQGLIEKEWWCLIDMTMACAIFLLNLYFFGRAMSWWHYGIGIVVLVYFLMSFYYYTTLTVHWYEIHTNIWHAGVILLIYLVPLSLKQKNLF